MKKKNELNHQEQTKPETISTPLSRVNKGINLSGLSTTPRIYAKAAGGIAPKKEEQGLNMGQRNETYFTPSRIFESMMTQIPLLKKMQEDFGLYTNF